MNKTRKKVNIDGDYIDKVEKIRVFVSADNNAAALRKIIDFFIEKNKGQMTFTPISIESKIKDLSEEMELLKEAFDELKELVHS